MARISFYDHPEVYDLLFSPEPPVLEFYAGQAANAGGPVLELGCGTGKLLVPIAQRGVDITGLDSAPAMLDRARTSAARAGVQVQLLEGDMRQLSLERKFALIFLGSNSLAHLSDLDSLKEFFAAVRGQLAPSGKLIFDVANPDVRTLALLADARRQHEPIAHSEWGDLIVEERSRYDAATQITNLLWQIRYASTGSAQTFALNLRNFFPRELELLLKFCGYDLLERLGDFRGEPFTSLSLHQICVCRPVPHVGT